MNNPGALPRYDLKKITNIKIQKSIIVILNPEPACRQVWGEGSECRSIAIIHPCKKEARLLSDPSLRCAAFRMTGQKKEADALYWILKFFCILFLGFWLFGDLYAFFSSAAASFMASLR
jgi:hypothetical protein